MATLDQRIRRWRADPISFITEVLRDPETNKAFVLLPAEIQFLKHAFTLTVEGRLAYPELVYACPKKSGKTTFGGIFMLTLLLLYGGRFGEGFVLANDLEQSIGRIFTVCVRIIEASPLLKREARITADKIVFPNIGNATITALANDFAGAAGAIAPVITTVDEGWAVTSERSRRTVDELIPTPTRKISCRLFTTYAGFSGESTLLEELYKRTMGLPEIAPDLRAGDGLLCFWTHLPVAPWQNQSWLAEMRRALRPNQFLRMIENRWVTSESSFVTPEIYDTKCVDNNLRPVVVDPTLPVFAAVDASFKHDSTAIVAVIFDRACQQVRMVNHKIFQPSPERPLDFEGSIEQTLASWHGSYKLRCVLYDPYQMVSSAQRLSKLGVPMKEYPQSGPALTECSQNLFELIQGGNLRCYPDAAIRLAMLRAVAIESSRGWRISKEKQSHKIDVVIALAMAAFAAVRDGGKKRELRMFSAPTPYGESRVIELDPRTGRPMQRRGHLYRDENGNLRLHSDNSCWPTAHRAHGQSGVF